MTGRLIPHGAALPQVAAAVAWARQQPDRHLYSTSWRVVRLARDVDRWSDPARPLANRIHHTDDTADAWLPDPDTVALTRNPR